MLYIHIFPKDKEFHPEKVLIPRDEQKYFYATEATDFL